jgi:O-antigen ligase
MSPTPRSSPGVVRPPARAGGRRELLAFSPSAGTVPGRGLVDDAIAHEALPTFGTARFKEPRDWGYVGLLAFTAVLLLRPQDDLPFLVPLHVAELCAAASIGPMVLHRFARRLPVFRVTVETIGLVAFGGVILATAPFSIWPGGAVGTFTDAYIKMLIVFVLMMNTLTTPKRLEQLTTLILFCVGCIAARGVADYARGVNLVEGDRLAGAVGGIFGNSNDLALNMVTFLPMAAVVALGTRQALWRRGAAALIVVLMTATVVFTKSRGGLIGLVVMLVVLLILGRRVRRGFAATVLVAIVAATPLMPASLWTRAMSIFDEQQDAEQFTGSREARIRVMQEGIDTFVEHPLTGIGAGQFRNYNPPGREQAWRETHNVLIQVAAETGILGLGTFVFLIVSGAAATRATKQMLARPPSESRPALSDDDRRALARHTVAMTAGLAGWFTCAMFASVAYNWTFYYLLALIVVGRELTRDRLEAVHLVDITGPTPGGSQSPRRFPAFPEKHPARFHRA